MGGSTVSEPRIAVIYGGVSAEREVSLRSGSSLAEALRQNFLVDTFVIETAALPPQLSPEHQVVFPALHGTFGEDGGIQQLLEANGFAFAGSGAEASRLCFNKKETKQCVAASGVRVAPDCLIDAQNPPSTATVIAHLGQAWVLKPIAQGSSVGLLMPRDESELATALSTLQEGQWLIEKKISGREITVGILEGKSLGLVEISPRDGFFDYAHKYTKSLTEYSYPAQLSSSAEAEMRTAAESAFAACGCRDFARIDFILSEEEEPYFLEINTLPGLTATSLLPMSASCCGYDFTELARRLTAPAIERFQCLTPSLS